jgi:hypothetical protein
MKKTTKTVLFLILVLSIVLGIVSTAQAKNASVFSISGGTEQQRAYVFQSLEESTWDWKWGSDVYRATSIVITSSFSPYWDETNALTAASWAPLPGDYIYKDDYGATLGVARYPEGRIWLNSNYMIPQSKGYIWEVPNHEAAHARVWFVWLNRADSGGMADAPACQAWCDLVSNVPPASWETSWYLMPWEAHAEMHRAYYAGDVNKHYNVTPRTNLRLLTTQQVFNFHSYWCDGEGGPEEPPIPPVEEQHVYLDDAEVYRSLDLYPETELLYWKITGTYEGPGDIWWFPEDWGDFEPYGVRATQADGKWQVIVPATAHIGPMLRQFKIVIYLDDEHQSSISDIRWYDFQQQPFPDIPVEDWDLYKSVHYVKWRGLMQGYESGYFGPWNSLLKSQICLIAARSEIPYPDEWVYDYSYATRGEVRQVFPNLSFDSERWQEYITRSQFARLITRTFVK